MKRRLFREAFRYYGLVLVAAVLAALLVVTVVSAINRAERAEDARVVSSAKATRRIDLLQARIADLEAESVERGVENGELSAQIEALAEQIRQAGGTPVVTPRRRTTTTTARRPPTSTTTSTRPASPTTSTTTAPPSSTTTRPCTVSIPNDGCV